MFRFNKRESQSNSLIWSRNTKKDVNVDIVKVKKNLKSGEFTTLFWEVKLCEKDNKMKEGASRNDKGDKVDKDTFTGMADDKDNYKMSLDGKNNHKLSLDGKNNHKLSLDGKNNHKLSLDENDSKYRSSTEVEVKKQKQKNNASQN